MARDFDVSLKEDESVVFNVLWNGGAYANGGSGSKVIVTALPHKESSVRVSM